MTTTPRSFRINRNVPDEPIEAPTGVPAAGPSLALHESEQQFRALFDQSPLAITLVSLADQRIVQLNHAAAATFGFKPAEMVAQSPVDLNLWIDPTRRPVYFDTLRQAGRITGFEAQFRRRNGEVFTGLCSGTLVTISDRLYAINSIQDITEAKYAAAISERSLALMRATLESTADGILVVNEEGRIETYNANFADMWGLPLQPAHATIGEESVLRKILPQLVSPELFLEGVRELYSRSDDEVFDILHCKDGRIFERFSRPQLIGAHLAGRVWSFRDITDQRRAEAALRESEERFRVLAEVSPVGIFSVDASGRTTFVNARWSEFAGVSIADALTHGWAQALHPADRDRVSKAWNDAVRAGVAWTAEFRFARPDGTITWLVGQSRPQHNAAGATTGQVATITDVTSLKRAEEERKKLETQLRQSSKMESLGTLAGGIAHDFNNILTGTFGFVDLARLELLPGHPAQLWLDKIAGSSHRARDLVRQILVFSRKDEGVRISQRLHSVVNEALRMLRSMLPPMVELEMRINTETPPVLADPNQVQQLIFNLCTNAWHALETRGSRIIVALESCLVSAEQAELHSDLHRGRWVKLSVIDNGCGMEAPVLEHIFEPFFTTKDPGAGTGLGLAVVHGIMQSHQGAIIVQSKPGVGTTFELYFPAQSAEAEQPGEKPKELKFGRGERIILVDDDAISGFTIEKLIETLNYKVRRFVRPEEALAHMTAEPDGCDLVVTDLAMPVMNGAELMGHLLKIRPTLPIIVITGYIEPTRAQLLEGLSVRAVLHKPVSRDDLASAIAANLPSK